MQAAAQWVLAFIMLLSLAGFGQPAPNTENIPASGTNKLPLLQGTGITLTGPGACPSSGCAGGQRVTMQFQYNFPARLFSTSTEPNVRICFYATSGWNGNSVQVESTGEITGKAYVTDTTGAACKSDADQPSGYNFLAESVSMLDATTPADAIGIALRLSADASGGGKVIYARLYTLADTGGVWSPTPAVSTNSPLLSAVQTSTQTKVYVAIDGAACGSNSPCFINSNGDSTGGIGTGLKDAVDAVEEKSSIYITGVYTVKTNTVLLDKKLTLTGVGDATITYSGSNDQSSCSQPLLTLNETVTVTGLNIDDSTCTLVDRTLIYIDSQTGRTGIDDHISIVSNDLTNGNYGILISAGTTDPIYIRFNQITKNAKSAVSFQGNGGSYLEIAANNLDGNSGSPAVNCGDSATAAIGNRKANHNYWGTSLPDTNSTHCTFVPTKRLGIPIQHNAGAPGVNAALVNVQSTKNYAASVGSQVGYNWSGTGSDFPMYIVNHGYMPVSGPPFTYPLYSSVSPCSNYWDVFLADGVSTSDKTLQLYFKYFNNNNTTPGCLAVINSTQYCDQQTSPDKYPLFWLDPSATTDNGGWHQTGAGLDSSTLGQVTTCHISDSEIQVSIDASGKPGLNDLGYTPFMVGVPVIKSIQLLASSQTVTINWSTNNEPDISGFNIWHGTDPNNLTLLNGTLITPTGNATTGAYYTRTDPGRVNGQNYYYKLEVKRTDGNSFYTAIKNILVNVATPLPTRTNTAILPSRTPTLTTVPSQRPTAIKSPTATLRQTTPIPLSTSMILPTLTATYDIRTPGIAETLTAIANEINMTQVSGGALTETPGPMTTLAPNVTPGETAIGSLQSSLTPPGNPSGVVESQSTGKHPWISLLLGILAGLVVVIGAGGWWYRSVGK